MSKLSMAKEQFRNIWELNETVDENLVDVDDHGWSTYEFIIEVDSFAIEELSLDPELLGTFWSLDVAIEPEWGVQWEMIFDQPTQVEKVEVVRTEWRAVK